MKQSTKTAPGEESADQLVDAIVTRSVERANEPSMAESVKKTAGLPPAAVFSGMVLVGALTVWNVMRYSDMPEGFTPPEANTYVQIFTASAAIERFADSVGRLPASLSQLQIDQSGLAYTPQADTYTLSTVVDGNPVTHQRGSPLVPPDSGFQSLQMRGPS